MRCRGLQRLAKPAYLEGFSFPCLAQCCTVLRSRWYQIGINRGIAASRSCSVMAFTRRTSSTSRDRLESGLSSAATLAGCLRWPLPPPTAWARRWANDGAYSGGRKVRQETCVLRSLTSVAVEHSRFLHVSTQHHDM